MIKRTLHLLAVVILTVNCHAQLNLNLLGQHQYQAQRGDCSDIWGYVDGAGNEYAIVGNQTGTSIMDVTDPANPVEVFYSAGDQTTWRDMKVWGTTAYITNEGGGGMKIIDLSNLPGPLNGGDVSQYNGSTYQFETAHNIFIDEVGRAYIVGADNGVGGAIILDLTGDPLNPTELGRYNDFYLHDIFVRNDTLWGGAIDDGFLVAADVSDPTNCTTLATHFTPSTFTHNVWLSDDGNSLFTTDEVSNAYIASYDVSDLGNIVEIDRIQSSPGQDVIPHNSFVIGDYLVTSYYRDGVVVHDITNPNNMIETGNYDTSPMSGDGFNGCWGVYPYLPSGNIIATDIEEGLFILGANYQQGAYLEGNVTDDVTTNPIDNAQIEIVATTSIDFSNVVGDYASGVGTGGTFDVTFSKLGYISQTITNVVLVNGNTTVVDVQLVPLPTFTLQGLVQDDSGTPISNVQVQISSPQFSTTVTTNGVGAFDVTSFLEGGYDVRIGLWGYHTLCLSAEQYNIGGGPYVYTLQEGYSDIFELDLGWAVSGNPDSGDWERDDPVGTTYFGSESNPEDDSQDCGSNAYITGNGGGQAGSDDIDGGTTVLTSPLFDLTSYNDAFISFDRWFYNGGGQGGTPNDSLTVILSNGTQSAYIDFATVDSPDLSSWSQKEIRVSDYLDATAFMQVKVSAMDINGGHLSEGGFDNFFVKDSIVDDSGIPGLNANVNIKVYPIPFMNEVNVELDKEYAAVRFEVLELTTGRLVDSHEMINTTIAVIPANYAKGVYLISVYGNEELLTSRRVIKM